MFSKSNRNSLIILGITALICSRAMFFFFNDPEGPNVPVVVGTAAIIYVVSLAIYLFDSTALTLKRLWLPILTQVLVTTGLYFLLS